MENENSGFYRRVLSAFAWQGSSKALVQLITWVNTVVVARILEPSDYGIMAIAGVFLALMIMLMDMGLSPALVQRTTVTEQEEDAVFWLSLSIGTALFGVLFLTAPLIGEFYDMPILSDVLQVCALVLVISSLKAVPQAILMRRLDFRSRALIELRATLASAAIVITLALNDFGVWSLALGMVAQQAVVTGGLLLHMTRLPRLNFRFGIIADVIRFGLHLMGANLAFVVSSGADVFIIGKVLGQHLSGIYSMAFQLATMPLDKIGTIFNQIAFPALSRVKDNDGECRRLFAELHYYLLFVAYPVLIGLTVVAEDFVLVVFGKKWAEVAPILQALCVANLIRVSGMLMTPALTSRGHAREALHYSVAGAIVLPLCFLVGVRFGLQGVAVAWIAGYPLLYAMLLRYLKRYLGVTLSRLVTDSRPTLLATTAMAGAVLLFQSVTVELAQGLRLGGSIAVGALAYTAVFFVFYGEKVSTMWRALRALRSGSSA